MRDLMASLQYFDDFLIYLLLSFSCSPPSRGSTTR